MQVPALENLAAIRSALAAGGNARAQIESLPGLNHLFQTAQTGTADEYARLDETIAPDVLRRIGAFVDAQR